VGIASAQRLCRTSGRKVRSVVNYYIQGQWKRGRCQ